jgi:hypothetical protein
MVTAKNPRFYRIEWKGDLIEAPTTVKRCGTVPFRPMTADITYMLKDDQWVPYLALITGPQLKKDNTDGKSLISSEYHLSWADDTPEWITALARLHTPKVVSS